MMVSRTRNSVYALDELLLQINVHMCMRVSLVSVDPVMFVAFTLLETKKKTTQAYIIAFQIPSL